MIWQKSAVLHNNELHSFSSIDQTKHVCTLVSLVTKRSYSTLTGQTECKYELDPTLLGVVRMVFAQVYGNV